MTSKINIVERGQYFLKFNDQYQKEDKIGIWEKLKFQLQSKGKAKEEVQRWAELQPMTLEFLGQKLDLIDMNDYPIELPTKALLIV